MNITTLIYIYRASDNFFYFVNKFGEPVKLTIQEELEKLPDNNNPIALCEYIKEKFPLIYGIILELSGDIKKISNKSPAMIEFENFRHKYLDEVKEKFQKEESVIKEDFYIKLERIKTEMKINMDSLLKEKADSIRKLYPKVYRVFASECSFSGYDNFYFTKKDEATKLAKEEGTECQKVYSLEIGDDDVLELDNY